MVPRGDQGGAQHEQGVGRGVGRAAQDHLTVVLFGRRIRDVTNNLKIMRREVVQDLRLRQSGFAVNAETGVLAGGVLRAVDQAIEVVLVEEQLAQFAATRQGHLRGVNYM